MAHQSCNTIEPPVRGTLIIGIHSPDISAAGIIFFVSAGHRAFNITVLACTPVKLLSTFLRPNGRFRHFICLYREKMPLMISARLHGYALRALLQR